MGRLVSILIPCYNAEATIGEAIRSALAQTYDAKEVLVVDDGSSDKSLDIIRSFEQSPGFKWTHTKNRGGNAARNLLIRQAEGEYVQFLDADDVLYPSKVAMQAAQLDEGVDIVFCDYVERPAGGQREHRVALPPPLSDLIAYVIRNSIWTSVPLHRRVHLTEAGGFDESLTCCQEYELHTRLAMSSWRTCIHVDRPLACRRRMPGSVSSNERKVFTCMLGLLVTWFGTLDREERLTPPRRRAIATVSYGVGRHLVALGEVPLAQDAFRLAKRSDPRAPKPVKLSMAALTRLVGPIRAELWRARLLKSLGR